MKIPTIPEIYSLYEKYALPPNIIRHCEQVSKVCIFIAKKLVNQGENINLELLRASALLHDIAKPVDFKNGELDPKFTSFIPTKEQLNKWDEIKKLANGVKHEQAGVLLLKDDYPKIAKVIGMHEYSKVNVGFDSWEEKILYYADKLVMHDKIVNLQKRMDEGHQRYIGNGPLSQEVIDTDKKIFELEEEIFKLGNIFQDEIIQLNSICIDKII